MPLMEPTKCICDSPGYCQLMRRRMSEVRHNECQNVPGYFEVFLEGRDRKPKRRGLGDVVAAFLERLGIRKRPGCGCEGRQAWLNRLGERIRESFL